MFRGLPSAPFIIFSFSSVGVSPTPVGGAPTPVTSQVFIQVLTVSLATLAEAENKIYSILYNYSWIYNRLGSKIPQCVVTW